MPVREKKDGHNDRQELQATKENLVRREVLHETLGSLCKSEARSEVDRQSCDDQSDEEAFIDRDWAFTGFQEGPGKRCEKHCKGEDLKGETGQEDVVECGRVLLVRVGDL